MKSGENEIMYDVLEFEKKSFLTRKECLNVLLRSEARGGREGITKFGSMEITDKILTSYSIGVIDV